MQHWINCAWRQTGTVYAQAGVPGAKLARFAALHNLGGAEFFAGIPGTVAACWR